MRVTIAGWLVVSVASMAVGCGVDNGYCCALEKVSLETDSYQTGYLERLSKLAEAENEDVCQTVVEANYERFEEALAECAGE